MKQKANKNLKLLILFILACMFRCNGGVNPEIPALQKKLISVSPPDNEGMVRVIGKPGAVSSEYLNSTLVLENKTHPAHEEAKPKQDGGFEIEIRAQMNDRLELWVEGVKEESKIELSVQGTTITPPDPIIVIECRSDEECKTQCDQKCRSEGKHSFRPQFVGCVDHECVGCDCSNFSPECDNEDDCEVKCGDFCEMAVSDVWRIDCQEGLCECECRPPPE